MTCYLIVSNYYKKKYVQAQSDKCLYLLDFINCNLVFLLKLLKNNKDINSDEKQNTSNNFIMVK